MPGVPGFVHNSSHTSHITQFKLYNHQGGHPIITARYLNWSHSEFNGRVSALVQREP